MSEIAQNTAPQPKKGRRPLSIPRIDMTPMVDLGFLLLTFFVLTTQMDQPKVMPVIVPAENTIIDPITPLACSKALTLIADKDDKLYALSCSAEGVYDLERTDYRDGTLRKTIFNRRERLKRNPEFANEADSLVVILKLTDHARFQNMVDLLDEMKITNAQYMLVETEPADLELITEYEKNHRSNAQ